MEALLSKTFQNLSKNSMANKMAKKYGLRFGAKRFVAGSNLEQAIESVRELNNNGMLAMLNYLGEFTNSETSASETTEDLVGTIKAIRNEQLDCYLSIKLSSIGLEIGKDVCLDNLKKILDEAEATGTFVRLEMENYSNCQKTLDIYKEMKTKYENIGTVIQAYLYRSAKDISDLNNYNANLRLVKGAYNESAEVAYPKKSDVDENFESIITTHLLNGNYAGVATHDDAAIKHTIRVAKQNNISKDSFEFQMLHGIRPDLQKQLRDEGYKIRVYLPFGSDWFGYFMRRLAERPENLAFVVKNTFKKGAV
ncbi:proline dehydrogenase family protein [Halobacillus sp. Marseille-P3879]|uniref:proline dehydrogenase family protein n=1 Tax=Halobacillus sp. Marseille-P3879 TaxID=2045014 RepID=UPI000C7B1048|nr:proline dehydrogenase family protein [Halobacillus sp. Marseille-P3879]